MHFAKYIQRAFLQRWNLLLFCGTAAFAILSPLCETLLPLVFAGELGYLGFIGTHPKFQAYVDAQDAAAARSQGTATSQQVLDRITHALPPELMARFEKLRSQCAELRQIAAELKAAGKDSPEATLDDFQLVGLDRLLWIYLRLLYTQHSLARFLKKTTSEEIQRDIQQLEDRLKSVSADSVDPQTQRVRKALADNLETSRLRLANLAKARDNYELVQLEIDRLENKIRSLSELAVNRQEPDFVSEQVDQVAASMLDTERTMNELKFVTGIDAIDESPPELLRGKVAVRQ